jgi:hypothetical protein
MLRQYDPPPLKGGVPKLTSSFLLAVARYSFAPALLLLMSAGPVVGQTDTAGGTTPNLPPFAPAADESANYVVETVNASLDRIAGLAMKPIPPEGGPYHLLIAADGEIVRISTAAPSVATPVVKGFPLRDAASGEPRLQPQGLEFLTRTKLAVGIVGAGAGARSIRVYALPDDGTPLAYEQVDHAVELDQTEKLAQSGENATGEATMFGLAKTDDAIFAALGDASDGWLLKANHQANRITDWRPFIAMKPVAAVAASRAVVVNPKVRAHYLVAAAAGEPNAEPDSVVGFYGPRSGAAALAIRTGLYDIVALAYSPGGDLYALDAALHDPKLGGLYRLDAVEIDDRQSCQAVKIASLVEPTAMLFTPDGALYVGAAQRPSEGESKPALLKITPRGDTPAL